MNIKIQVRIRPPGANPAMQFDQGQKKYHQIDYNDEILQLNNEKFKFEHIFDEQATQEQVYDHLVKPLVPEFVSGFNCCVFCYGQTGSGKTYTQTGGTSSYTERGLMPRAIEHLFQMMNDSQDRSFELFISYCQILNEGGFDLLSQSGDPNQRTHDGLRRIKLLETEDNVIKVRELAAFQAKSVEEALNVLWNGDMNRVVTATSQNQSSSRSHCIFTLQLCSKPNGSEVVRKSKFHFVDLAGSERVSKTGANGLILSQARYINVSLFHLETVIQALARSMHQPDTHVPYRNSMMTLYLKDSLGGNCKTAMLATVAVEEQNLDESIATCHFAMQVGSIKNSAKINEEIDPKLLIARLKTENKLLKEELKLMKEGQAANAQSTLSEEEMDGLRKACREFLNDMQKQTLDVGSWFRLQAGFRYIRELYIQKEGTNLSSSQPINEESEVFKLRKILQQRDAEIDILTQMAGGQAKPQNAAKGPGYTYDGPDVYEDNTSSNNERELKFVQESNSSKVDKPQSANTPQIKAEPMRSNESMTSIKSPPRQKSLSEHEIYLQILSDASKICQIDLTKLTIEKLKNEEFVFAQFQSKYYGAQRLLEDKNALSELYKKAKAGANEVVGLKGKAEATKNEFVQMISKLGKETEESDVIKDQLGRISTDYQAKVGDLRSLKGQIESLEADMKINKEKMNKDFVRWYKFAVQFVQSSTEQKQPPKMPKKERPESIDKDIEDEINEYYSLKKRGQ